MNLHTGTSVGNPKAVEDERDDSQKIEKRTNSVEQAKSAVQGLHIVGYLRT